MIYKDYLIENKEEYGERLELAMDRISEIAVMPEVEAPYDAFFLHAARYQEMQYIAWNYYWKGIFCGLEAADLQAMNQRMYEPFFPENYDRCYANPAYAVQETGEDYGQLLAAFYALLPQNNIPVFHGDCRNLCICAELFLELHSYFACPEELSPACVKESMRSFMHDYAELFMESRAAEMLDPDYGRDLDLILYEDLSKPVYLFSYGMYVSYDELQSQRFLAGMSEEEIQAMASTFTEGYRKGFISCGKDITKKKLVEIRYPLGFERMVRAAVDQFALMGLRPVLRPSTSSYNKQMDYDHKEDAALWLDKEMVEYQIRCYQKALDNYKETAQHYGGPAVIEVFGEEPFAPAEKRDNPQFDEKQRRLSVYQRSSMSRLMNEAVHGDEYSFTIIAYPVRSIGKDYKEIFAETLKLNNLDPVLYCDMQQRIIDCLDQADKVHIKGCGVNRTDLYVKIWELADPEKETAFENCLADVNIPVGEVFTSPVLEGTAGKLHVSRVFLGEYCYENLEIDFENGMICDYSCSNFPEEEQNRKYIENNILFHHETLPLGEFAIGTNTTAYRMGKVYGIEDKMPILIAEKTGPHFAVGDTCYTYDEDNITYNPDGKSIVARENSVSAQRKEAPEKAYVNCHTDITIPYDEIGAITVIRKDGTTIDIIRDGRFVVAGTEELNKPLDQLDQELGKR